MVWRLGTQVNCFRKDDDPTGTLMRRKSAWPRKHCFVRIHILDGRIIQLHVAVSGRFFRACNRLFPAPRPKAKRGDVHAVSEPLAALQYVYVEKVKELIRQWQQIRVH